MRDFLKDGLSLDEYKTSSLILGFLGIIGAIIVSYFTTGHIPSEFTQLAETFIYAIAGVNAAHGVAKMVNGKSKENKSDETKG